MLFHPLLRKLALITFHLSSPPDQKLSSSYNRCVTKMLKVAVLILSLASLGLSAADELVPTRDTTSSPSGSLRGSNSILNVTNESEVEPRRVPEEFSCVGSICTTLATVRLSQAGPEQKQEALEVRHRGDAERIPRTMKAGDVKSASTSLSPVPGIAALETSGRGGKALGAADGPTCKGVKCLMPAMPPMVAQPVAQPLAPSNGVVMEERNDTNANSTSSITTTTTAADGTTISSSLICTNSRCVLCSEGLCKVAEPDMQGNSTALSMTGPGTRVEITCKDSVCVTVTTERAANGTLSSTTTQATTKSVPFRGTTTKSGEGIGDSG